jgi:hypothetical protein
MNAQTHIAPATLYIGQPVMGRMDRAGWIAQIQDRAQDGMRRSIFGASGLIEVKQSIAIVYDDGTYATDCDEHTATEDAAKAARYMVEAKDAADVAALFQAAKDKRAAQMEEARREREAYAAKVEAWQDEIRPKIPAWAKAVIVAELEIDDCDSMTDYFNTKTERVLILGFSKHTRDLFSEMRKHAAAAEETAHLADAPESAEHREKYSMGAGYYLKDSHRYSTGWTVRKRSFYGQTNDLAKCLPYGEWRVPEQIKEPRTARDTDTPTAESVTLDGFTISQHTHTKKGFQMWIVAAGERVTRDTFQAWLTEAKSRGGWYSRKWGSTPAGFAFKSEDAARDFAASVAE